LSNRLIGRNKSCSIKMQRIQVSGGAETAIRVSKRNNQERAGKELAQTGGRGRLSVGES